MKSKTTIAIGSKLLLNLLLLSLLSACGGGGGGTNTATDPNTNTSALAVDHVSPASNATGASLTATVSITFNKNIDCTSVSDATFTVVDANSVTVNGTASCSGATATFTPAAPLAGGVQYTATVAATVKDSGGATLSGSQSWSFTTNASGKVAVPILGTITGLSVAAVGADSAGNAIMLYRREQDATHYTIGAMRYTQATGTWPIASHNELGTDVRNSGLIELAVNKNGYALALWSSYNGGGVYSAYYNPTSNTWTGKTIISVTAGALMTLDAKIDDNGNAMATWGTQNGGNRQVFARYYSKAGGSWGAEHDLSTYGWTYNQNPRFAFDPSGNGMVVFEKARALAYSGYQITTASLSYDATTDTWSDPVDIAADCTNPDIGFDANGKAIAVWVKKFNWNDPQFPPAHDYYGVGFATRTSGNAWSVTSEDVGWDPKGNASAPRVLVTPAGDAMAVWLFTRGTGYHYNINAAYMTAGASTWGQAGENVGIVPGDNYAGWRVVSGDGLGADAFSPKLALDANGKATLVYGMSDGTRYNVYSRNFTHAARTASSSGWTAIREIDTTNSDAFGGVVTVAGTGFTMTLWDQADGNINDFCFLRE